MRAICLVGAVFVLSFLAGCESSESKTMENESAKSSGQHRGVFKKKISRTVRCQYLLYLPAGYGQSEQAWPLIIFLHGVGERGDDLEKVKVHGIPKLLEQGKDFPFIVLSPQCPEEGWWGNNKIIDDVLMNLLDDIISQYDVDADRVYLTGLSMGGYGTWDMAGTHPERFAAIAPICGGGRWFYADKLKEIPIWAFHGAKDDVVPLKESQEMVDAVNKAGGDAKLTVYPEADHDAWTVTYDNKELYDWFLEHRKEAK